MTRLVRTDGARHSMTYRHDGSLGYAKTAAAAIARGHDMPGGRWRLVTTFDHSTIITEIPTASLWLVRRYAGVLRRFGRDMAVVDWNTMPARDRSEPKRPTELSILAQRTADLLWASRHALTARGDAYGMENGSTSTTVELSGGVTLRIDTTIDDGPRHAMCSQIFTVGTPIGDRTIEGSDAAPLRRIWRAIILQRVMDALEPGRHELDPMTDPTNGATAVVGRWLERFAPTAHDATYMGRMHYHQTEAQEYPSPWRRLVDDVMIRTGTTWFGHRRMALVTDGQLGATDLDPMEIQDAEDRRLSVHVEAAMGAVPPRLAGPSSTGSPRAALLARILRDALARWPDLTDAAGTPIAPLLDRHLPRLLQAYMDERDLPGADHDAALAQLEQGLERIEAALDEALAARKDVVRDDLRTEVAFLRARHPSEHDAIGEAA